MNVTGVVVEYNPFHNGHKLHIEQARASTGADLIIAVMSGNFLQRGEPALVSKWTRTKMAILAGVDIVVELPYVFATQHAEVFAHGAISILNEVGVKSVCFGSESGEIDQFTKLVTFINKQKDSYDSYIQEALKKGYSYPKSLALAFNKINNENEYLDLSLPNNILGYHYVKAIIENNIKMKPYTIKRTKAQYHDRNICDEAIASATSIREALLKKNEDLCTIKHVVPETTYNELVSYMNNYTQFQHWERLFPYLKYKVLTTNETALKQIYEAEEGLENRLYNIIKDSDSFQQLMEKLKTKRYTWTRLQRFCLHTLTNTLKDEMSITKETPPYIRILGMNKNGRQYLNSYKKRLNVPLISNISKLKHPFLDVELRAAACYSLSYPAEVQKRLLKEEYAQPPIII